MNTKELVEYKQKVQKYMEDHKMRDVFENLTKLLVLNKPTDPLKFLIDYLENRRVQRLILVSGVVAPNRQEIVSQLANLFNYKVIAIEDLFRGDIGWMNNDTINQAIIQAYKNTEKHYRGIIISGYPNNINQAYFLQQQGIIPERFIYLESELDFARQYYDTFCPPEMTTKCLTRDRLNRKELQNIYGNYIDVFNTSKRTRDDIIENIKQILRLRDRKYPPLRFPRICIIRPPSLKERSHQLVDIFSKRYGFKPIITFKIMEQQIANKGSLAQLLQQNLLQSNTIPNDIVNSLVYTQFLETEARTKGWVLEGFPKNDGQLKFLENQFINLFIILSEDEDVLITKSKQLKIDPITKVKYEKVPLNDKPLLNRLINYQGEDDEQIKRKVNQYLEFIQKIEQQYGDKVQKFKLEKDPIENIVKLTDVFLNNPQIYN